MPLRFTWNSTTRPRQTNQSVCRDGRGTAPGYFAPTFPTFKARTVGGVQLHVHDRESFDPVRTGMSSPVPPTGPVAALRSEKSPDGCHRIFDGAGSGTRTSIG
ncbi:hypothetical protein ACFXI8_19055 [Streptomyces niveus]|uniref:hypothetical protein n=1 Tax=Streptomyces niveus TaxID=193462 RepID=UPI003687AB99